MTMKSVIILKADLNEDIDLPCHGSGSPYSDEKVTKDKGKMQAASCHTSRKEISLSVLKEAVHWYVHHSDTTTAMAKCSYVVLKRVSFYIISTLSALQKSI